MSYSWAGAKKKGRALKRRQYIWFLRDKNSYKDGQRGYSVRSYERVTWGTETRKMFKKAKSRRERYQGKCINGPVV